MPTLTATEHESSGEVRPGDSPPTAVSSGPPASVGVTRNGGLSEREIARLEARAWEETYAQALEDDHVRLSFGNY